MDLHGATSSCNLHINMFLTMQYHMVCVHSDFIVQYGTLAVSTYTILDL